MSSWGEIFMVCGFTVAGLYFVGSDTGRAARFLKSVTRVDQVKELAKLLDVEGKLAPVVVAVSGRVGSETPMNCENTNLKGIIVQETIKQEFLKCKDNGSWIRDSAVIWSKKKLASWYLHDGTDRVSVSAADKATGIESLLTVADVYEPSSSSPLDCERCIKILGVHHIEAVLPIDTSLTVVGEAIKDGTGTVTIQCPRYIFTESIDQYIQNLVSEERWFKLAAMGLTVLGCLLITNCALQRLLKRRQRIELDGAKGERRIQYACDICHNHEVESSAVFCPCSNMSYFCTMCYPGSTCCPLCGRRIKVVVEI